MSGRLAAPLTNRTSALAAAALVALCGAACGLLAQPPGTQPGAKADEPDTKSPLPPDGRHAKAYEKYAIPEPDRMMFAWIEDFKPVAPEDKNSLEYLAWVEFVQHAKKFSAAELERHAVRDLTPLDLIKVRTPPDPKDPARPRGSPYRCELLRFDGKLVCVRKLPAPKFFADNPGGGVTEMFEARLVPLDESPLTPVSVVFLELPEALKAVADKPPLEWVDFDAWVSAAGYFFKTMSVPGEQGKVAGVPVLVGKSVTPLPGPPVPPGDDPTALDPNVRLYKFIRDDSAMIRSATTEATWPEVAAENRVILHANRFAAEELERHALTGVRFADLFEDVRASYKLKNVKLEGRLIEVRRVEPNDELRAAGVNTLFEGWLIPANEPSGNPVCVLYTEPLPGVEPGARLNMWVTFAGYSFKLMRYTSAEKHEDEAKGYKVKRAPLLIGKRPVERPDPARPGTLSWSLFGQVVLGFGAFLALAALGLTWWYRGGDRAARRAAQGTRGGNPFDPAAGARGEAVN